jgi:hypothetical protein
MYSGALKTRVVYFLPQLLLTRGAVYRCSNPVSTAARLRRRCRCGSMRRGWQNARRERLRRARFRRAGSSSPRPTEAWSCTGYSRVKGYIIEGSIINPPPYSQAQRVSRFSKGRYQRGVVEAVAVAWRRRLWYESASAATGAIKQR